MEADDLRTSDAAADQQAAASDRALADKLDAAAIDQVFHRALELEAEALDEPHLFDTDQLERIADEINMDVSFVQQALGEVRLAPRERGRLDRWILPEHIFETATFEGVDRDELTAAVDEWMRKHEGLLPAGQLEDGTEWDVDRRLATRLKTMRTSGGNRISRVAGGDVAHRVHSIGDDEHVVAMQSRGEGPLLLAKAGLAAAVVIVLMGGIGALGASSLTEALRTVASLLVVGGGVATAAVLGARRWARGIGRALKRSLTGLATKFGRRRRGSRATRDGAELAGEVFSAIVERLRARRNRGPR